MASESANQQILDWAWAFSQDCLRSNPVLVIGSGASAPLTIPTMPELGKYLIEKIDTGGVPEDSKVCWLKFRKLVTETGLERAIDESDVWRDDALYKMIRCHAWSCIAARDIFVHELILNDRRTLALTIRCPTANY